MTEADRDSLAERFAEHRPYLRAVGYRMLGSLTEADDAVQEAWVRLSRSDTSEIEDLRAWLTTVVARVCLNELHSRDVRREEPLGVHVPDPIVSTRRRERPRAAGAAGRLCRPRPAGRPRPRSSPRSGSRSCCMTCSASRLVNGTAGLVTASRRGELFSVQGFTVSDSRIVEIDILADAERLARLDVVVLDD